jgi:hypothetical protein
MTTKTHYIAQEYIASSPEAEIIGALMLALVQNLKADELVPMLKTYGLADIDPNKWYPQQLVLDFFKAVAANSVNVSENFVAMGMKSMDMLPIDPRVKTFEESITAFDSTNQQITRNIPADEVLMIAESTPDHVLLIANMPYPIDMVYGYVWVLARRYKPANRSFTVTRVDNPTPDQYPGSALKVIWS